MRYILILALVATIGAGCASKPIAENASTPQPAVEAPKAFVPPTQAPVVPTPRSAVKEPSLQPSAVPVPKPGPVTLNVTINDGSFSPKVLAIHVGDTVVWTNKGKANHTVNGTDAALLWDSGNLAPGQTYKKTFKASGSYPYVCAIHPSMIAQVIVYDVQK